MGEIHELFVLAFFWFGLPGRLLIFCQFFYSKQQEVPGTPAGRSPFVPPSVPGTLGWCPGDFLKFLCPL